MHLHTLKAENFKRLRAVRIEFPEGGGAVEICGANSQGKSSTIDAIWAGIGGTKAAPDMPIRQGARKATVELDLGDLRVRREWDSHGARLTVTDAEGGAMATPQRILDRLFVRLGFDPLEFTRMKPKEQAEALRRVAGLNFSGIDAERKAAFDERTEVNRVVKAQEARLAAMPNYEPVEPVDVADLNRALREATAHNNVLQGREYRVREATRMVHEAAEDVVRCQAALDHARRKLTTAEGGLAAERENLAKAGDPIDPAPIMDRIQQATAINERARAARVRAELEADLDASRDRAAGLTDKIDDLDAYRARLLAEAPIPVPGLSLEGEGVVLDGVPLEQASSSQRIRVGLAMAAAMRPELKVVAIREGSLLDEASLRLVAEWAAANGYQVLVERVAAEPSGAGVVIEEGAVAESRGIPESRPRRRAAPATPSMFDEPHASDGGADLS